jgi:toxin HigB-1
MILTFGNKLAQDLWEGIATKETRRFPHELHGKTQDKLDMIDAATRVEDLRSPPGNRLEKLVGDWSGFYSIRINDQFRIVFKWDGANAREVSVLDYH